MDAGLRALLKAALEAADPAAAVSRSLRFKKSRLIVLDPTENPPKKLVYELNGVRRIFVIGAGKAAPAMAAAIESVLGPRITDGLVITKAAGLRPLRRIRVRTAGHPIPNRAGRIGSEKLIDLVTGLGPDDLVLFLLSGGASALLPFPAKGISLRDKRRVTDQLLRSGATIQEINAVRKHLSRLKGGQLAALCRPARVVSGNPVDAIGSGPTAADPTTFKDAVTILKKYRLWNAAPHSIKRYLEAGRRGARRETPKPGDPLFRRVQNVIIGDNRTVVGAVAEQARASGWNTMVLTTKLQGEAREAAAWFGRLAREVRVERKPIPRPACLVAGGELTVTVSGKGSGGRCQELALAAVKEINGFPGTMLAAFGTDGRDGPTDAAGAVVDGKTLLRALRKGLDPESYLARNDSHRFFKKLGGLIQTGPTGTNLNDIYLLLVR